MKKNILLMICVCVLAGCSGKKETKVVENVSVSEVLKPVIPEGNYPDYIFYDGGQFRINGLFVQRMTTDKVYGVTAVETFEKFTDEDYLKTLELIEKSDIQYVEIRFRKEKTEMIVRNFSRYAGSDYGVMASDGGITKNLLTFMIKDGKVYRLTEDQLDLWE